MHKTAQFIEETKAQNAEPQTAEKPKRGKHPNSLKNLVAPWTSETRPQSPGRPRDTAADIARKAFEKNQEAIYHAAVEQLLKGNPYAFSVFSDRAFGKLKQGIVHTGDEEGGPIKSSITVEFVEPGK